MTDILTVGMRADQARRATHGARVTYQRVHVLSPSDVRDGLAIPDAASEVRLVGAPVEIEAAVAMVARLKQAAAGRTVAAFSLADLPQAAALSALVRAGLDDVAEVPIDVLNDLEERIRAARAAGLRIRRVTVAHASPTEPEILNRLARLVQADERIERFAPLPRNLRVDKPTTGYQDVRAVALARLALSRSRPDSRPISIEVDWRLYGPKLAQVALTFGADHLDAVPATTDESLGRRRATVEDVERNIRAAGFEPQEYRPTA